MNFAKKCILVILLAVIAISAPVFAETPSTGRTWGYLNFVAAITPEWSFTAMPGARYEYYRSDKSDKAPVRKIFMYEFFTGITYTMKFDNLKIALPVQYYYLGFPVRKPAGVKDTYDYQSNIEFIPTISYRWGNFDFIDRVILHNTVYASTYATASERKGYSLLMRELVRINYWITPEFALNIAEEFFYGLRRDRQAAPSSLGFSSVGLSINRLYAGFEVKFMPELSLTTQYIYETNYNPYNNEGKYKVIQTNHYVYLTLTYVLKLF